MDARFIILLIMSALLLGWVIFCGIQFFRHSKDLIVAADFIGHVKCEKCGTLYDVNAAQFTESHMSKSVSTSKHSSRTAHLSIVLSIGILPKNFTVPAAVKRDMHRY